MKIAGRILRMLRRASVPDWVMIGFLYRVFRAIYWLRESTGFLRWYPIILIFEAIHSTGLQAAAEWFARVSGLRAKLESVLKEPPRVAG